MFLGGAGLADTMLYCRHNLYPVMPTGVAHALALVLGLLGVVLGAWVRFLPPRPNRLTVSVVKQGELHGQFAFLMVTTLQRLLFKGNMPGAGPRTGKMQLLVIERDFRRWSAASSRRSEASSGGGGCAESISSAATRFRLKVSARA